MNRNRNVIKPFVVGVVGLFLLLQACYSPNGGYWAGTFEGHVSGTMEFSINRRGTKLKGKMTGQTQEGYSFKADLKGTLRGPEYRASFEGKSQNGIRFTGIMRGNLAQGVAEGSWEATVFSLIAQHRTGNIEGRWQADQVK